MLDRRPQWTTGHGYADVLVTEGGSRPRSVAIGMLILGVTA